MKPLMVLVIMLESTERQKVHEDSMHGVRASSKSIASESTEHQKVH